MMVTSGFNFEGYKITKYLGFYSGECALGTGFLSSWDAGIADLLGSNSAIYEEKLLKAKSMAISELKKTAKEHGADAIIGLDVDYTTFSADIMGVIANGTAVKIEEIPELGKNQKILLYTDQYFSEDKKNINIPVISYYSKLSFRPYNLMMNLKSNRIKIFIYQYKKESLSAINADIMANTIFGTAYEFSDINFVDFSLSGNTVSSEEVPLNIDENQLKVIKSITIKINHYILSGKVYSLNEPCQVSNMKVEELLKFRKNYGFDAVGDFRDDFSWWTCICGCKNDESTKKCIVCERIKREYSRAKSIQKISLGSLMPELVRLHNCEEICSYLENVELEKEMKFPEEIMDDVNKMARMERSYGNMKESLVGILEKYISENE